MRSAWTKQRLLALAAVLALLCALVKLGIELGRPDDLPGEPTVASPGIRSGHPNLRRSLPPSGLRGYLSRGIDRIFGRRHTTTAPGGQTVAHPDRAERADGRTTTRRGEGPGPDGKGAGGDPRGKPATDPTIPRADDPTFPYRLVAVVQTTEPQPIWQAVVRHAPTGTLHRMAVGDVLGDALRLQAITDDSVILIEADGTRHTFHGRFRHAYSQ